MVETLLLENMSIPYGVLHDQKLLCVKQENSRLIFTFLIDIFEQNNLSDFCLKYKDFNRCDMIVELGVEEDDGYRLTTSVDSHNKFHGLLIDKEEFLNSVNGAVVTFVDCHANEYSFTVNLDINFYNSQHLKKYKKYFQATAEFCGIKSVIFNWYNN